MQRVSPKLLFRPSFNLANKRKQGIDKTLGKIKVTCCSQGKGLTVTHACDRGKMCHLGLFLLHAIKAHGMALPQQAHACTKFHHCFQHSRRQLNFSACFTRRRAIKSGVGKHSGVMMASSGNSSPAKAQGRRRRVSDLPSGGHLCGTCSLSSCGASAASVEQESANSGWQHGVPMVVLRQ